ncbi:MAG TPA: DASS family sodium-coupled anion symporter [Saprospiraceae bacterium]|nr:DASS family sodium-coupled anion symporter [Saprospiraceae bacterium]
MKIDQQILKIIAVVFIVWVYWFVNPLSFTSEQVFVSAIALLMIAFWTLELLPLPVVALFPILIFPYHDVLSWDSISKAYSNPMIFLFMGGFFLSLAIEKWNLHKRIALNIINFTGTSGNKVILGFIISTGFLSMWLSNTATTMMMFPIALAVIKMVETTPSIDSRSVKNFSFCMMIVIAYASNFGGIATIIGTPPNVAFNSYLQSQNHQEISFFKWMAICTPLAIVILICLYFILVKFMYPNTIKSNPEIVQFIKKEIKSLGKMNKAEISVISIFLFTVILWIFKDLLNGFLPIKLDDTRIALTGGILLFIIRIDKSTALLEWEDTKKMSWGILLLFGGGMALANALEKVGLLKLIGEYIQSFGAIGFSSILIMIILISIFLSELMSNIAQVIVLAPIIGGIAESMNYSGIQLGLAMTLAASCASMLPMGTPPNAIAFSSGMIEMRSMLKIGFIMNLVCIVLIFLFCRYIFPFTY